MVIIKCVIFSLTAMPEFTVYVKDDFKTRILAGAMISCFPLEIRSRSFDFDARRFYNSFVRADAMSYTFPSYTNIIIILTYNGDVLDIRIFLPNAAAFRTRDVLES
jgi:hypothetical protein